MGTFSIESENISDASSSSQSAIILNILQITHKKHVLHPVIGTEVMTCWISYRTNFRRAARRFWLKIEVPRITKMIFLLVLSKDTSKISS